MAAPVVKIFPQLKAAFHAEHLDERVRAFGHGVMATCSVGPGGSPGEAIELLKSRWPDSAKLLQKAAIATTTDATFASPLDGVPVLAESFLAGIARPMSVLGKLADFVEQVPFEHKWPVMTTGSTATWVGQAQPIKVSSAALDSFKLKLTKIATMLVVSEELVRSTDPRAVDGFLKDLGNAVAEAADTALLDPDLAAVAGTNPGSITNGVTPIVASGTTAAALRADVRELLDGISVPLRFPHLIMNVKLATGIGMMDGLGNNTVLGPQGGILFGIPVVVSSAAGASGSSPGEYQIVAVEASELAVADDGIELTTSQKATVDLGNSPADGTETISLWQHNAVGLLALRRLSWQMRISGAVAHAFGNWGE